MTDKSLPRNVEFEADILGNILLNETALEYVLYRLSPKELYSTQHQLVLSAMLKLSEKGVGIDVLTMREQLEVDRKLEQAGTSSYLTYLTQIAIRGSDIEYKIQKVKEAAQKRMLWEKAQQLATAIVDDEVPEYISRLKDELAELNFDSTTDRPISLSAYEPELLEWIIKDAIPDKFPSIIYSDGGMGKSYLALYLSILVAMGGKQFLGLEFTEKPRNVLYLDWELDANVIADRAQKIAKGLCLPKPPENVYYLSPKKSLEKTIPTIKGLIGSKKIGFIIIDSFGASAVDGESVPDIVGVFTEIKNLGCASLILDHQSKMQAKDKYSQKSPYGSVYKTHLARSVFQLARAEKYDPDSKRVSLLLSHKKSNFGRLLGDLVFDISWQGDRVLFLESNALPPEERDLKLVREAIKELSEEGGRVNQKNLKLTLHGTIGKNRVSELLDKGSGKYWNSEPGLGKEIIYKPIMLNDNSYELPEVLRD